MNTKSTQTFPRHVLLWTCTQSTNGDGCHVIVHDEPQTSPRIYMSAALLYVSICYDVYNVILFKRPHGVVSIIKFNLMLCFTKGEDMEINNNMNIQFLIRSSQSGNPVFI